MTADSTPTNTPLGIQNTPIIAPEAAGTVPNAEANPVPPTVDGVSSPDTAQQQDAIQQAQEFISTLSDLVPPTMENATETTEGTLEIPSDVAPVSSGSLAESSGFWVFLAFIIFVAIAARYAFKPLLAGLDARSAKIRADIQEAEKLKSEAKALLADYEKKHRDAMSEAETLIKEAQTQAELIKKEAAEKLQNQLMRREEQAEAKIRMAEEAAINDIRNQIVDVAADAAADLLKKQSDGKTGDDMLDRAIKDIRKLG